jgi:hypothetical protein
VTTEREEVGKSTREIGKDKQQQRREIPQQQHNSREGKGTNRISNDEWSNREEKREITK